MVAEVGQQENGDRADATSGTSYQHCAITRGHQLGLQSLHIKKCNYINPNCSSY
jgi:hypothetical protein